MDSGLETSSDKDSGHYYHAYHPRDPFGHHYPLPLQSLYLYSPSNNTLIPCQEMIIPNHAMSPDGSAYSGHTTVYLTYPYKGPDVRGYVTQPVDPSYSVGSSMSQDSCSQSYNGSNSSSIHHSFMSEQDPGSISITQPISPPPLHNFNTKNWIKQDQPPLIPPIRDINFNHPLSPNPDGYPEYEAQQMDKYADKPSRLKSGSTNSAGSIATVSYIPGLPPDMKVTRKSRKKRKKKTKTATPSERRGSTSSEPEKYRFSVAGECKGSQADNELRLELTFDDFVSELTVGSMQEIHLTDDLADSLVNPPTDLEDFDNKFPNHSSETLVNLPTQFEVYENNEKVVSEANKALVDDFVVQNTNDNSEWKIIESKKRHVECVSLPVPVEVHYERSATFNDSS